LKKRKKRLMKEPWQSAQDETLINAMSVFKAELRRQAEDEVQTLRELNTEEVRIFREKNTRNRAELMLK
jgi:hypothetical protein